MHAPSRAVRVGIRGIKVEWMQSKEGGGLRCVVRNTAAYAACYKRVRMCSRYRL